MRYLIDQRGAEPETALAMYRIALAWAADQGDRFVIRVQRGIYEDPGVEARLLALGEITAVRAEVSSSFFGRKVAKTFWRRLDVAQVEGTPRAEFVGELTCREAPSKATTGDLCPVEDVVVLKGDRILFGSYEYGRDLMLDLDPEELDSLRAKLQGGGLEPIRVIPAPKADTKS